MIARPKPFGAFSGQVGEAELVDVELEGFSSKKETCYVAKPQLGPGGFQDPRLYATTQEPGVTVIIDWGLQKGGCTKDIRKKASGNRVITSNNIEKCLSHGVNI